ncbi:Ras guanine nucleotide exchange factor [Pelomyxa schiedti]|nr:Ras guanine nucleotide exchange factor [Pelomyxa schiedti]
MKNIKAHETASDATTTTTPPQQDARTAPLSLECQRKQPQVRRAGEPDAAAGRHAVTPAAGAVASAPAVPPGRVAVAAAPAVPAHGLAPAPAAAVAPAAVSPAGRRQRGSWKWDYTAHTTHTGITGTIGMSLMDTHSASPPAFTSSDDSSLGKHDHRRRRGVNFDKVASVGDIRALATSSDSIGQLEQLNSELRASAPQMALPQSDTSSLSKLHSSLSISSLPIVESGATVPTILCESIFVNFPVRAVHFQSGRSEIAGTSPPLEPKSTASQSQPLQVAFSCEFLSPPKVCAWSLGSPSSPAMSTVSSSKISATVSGFNVALEGNHVIYWISYTTPTTHAALKDAIRLCLAHPRDNISPGLLEKLEDCTKTLGINGAAADGQTLLHAAAYAGNLELIKWLLKREAEIESKDELGWTPIMCAINQGYFSIAQFLISKGATISVITCRKQTPLHLLAKSYKQEDELAYKLLRTILSSHCPVNAKTDTGDTALMFACCVSNIQIEFITTLLESKADPNIPNNKGETPLSKATETNNPELIEALAIYNTSTGATQIQTPAQLDISTLAPELPPGTQSPLPLEVSGRFKVQQRRMTIDFSAPFLHPPTVLVWSFSGSRSQIPIDRVTPSQLSFAIALDGLPLASALNWVAYLPLNAILKSSLSKRMRLLGTDEATIDTVEQNKPPSGPPVLELLYPNRRSLSVVPVSPRTDSASLTPIHVEHITEELYTPVDLYEKFQEDYHLFEEPDSEDNVRWMRIPLEAAANLAPGSREYMIRGGTVYKLVQYLTHQEESDMDFVHSFLISHSAYVEDVKLLDILVARFFMRRPDTFDSEEFNTKIRTIVRLRVVNILRTWATLYFDDFQDPEHLQKLRSTLEIFSKYCKAATVVLSLIARKVNTIIIPITPPPAIILKADVTSLMDIHPEELARQMTLIEWNIWRKIRPREFVRNAWNKQLLKEKLAPNITNMIMESNKRTMWCISEVVRYKHEKERAVVIHRLILTADACFRMRNFNGLMEIVSALQNSAVHRLKQSWTYLPPTTWDLYDKYCEFLDAKGNFQLYREAVKVAVAPCIPYLGMILTDLTFANDGNPDLIAGTPLINFAKYRHTSGIVKSLQLWQLNGYTFEAVERIQNYMNNSPVLTADESFDLSLSLEPPNKSPTPAKTNTSALEKISRDIFGKDATLLLKAQKASEKLAPKGGKD